MTKYADKRKIISHRLDVAFILFVTILVSFAPTVFLGDDKWTIIPLFLLLVLIVWLIYSSIVKKRLLSDGTITNSNTDFINNFIWDFKPNSKIKYVLAAYGMTIGIIILLTVIVLIISPELPMDIALSPLGPVLFCGLFIASYFILKKRIK